MQEVGICKTLYSNLKVQPTHSSECSSQLVFGELVQILENGAEWSLVKTEHGYSGWCRTAHLLPIAKDQLSEFESGEISILHQSDFIQTETSGACLNKMDFLPPRLISGSFIPPPFQHCFSGNHLKLGTNLEPFSGMKMAEMAQHYLGTVYLWGGKTPFGFDCSGLVQFMINLQGYSFPRDAWQQAQVGEEIAYQSEFPEFEPGTLLFFQFPEKKIHHVGISSGGSRFIHSADWVRVQSLNPNHSDFAPERLKTLVKAKEIGHLPNLAKSFGKLLLAN